MAGNPASGATHLGMDTYNSAFRGFSDGDSGNPASLHGIHTLTLNPTISPAPWVVNTGGQLNSLSGWAANAINFV
jgi:hypothetical protein